MSEWLVLTLAMAAACAVVLVVTIIQQRRIGTDDDPTETPDVIEYMTMMIGVVYAIVLGLAIAGVWEARNAAQANVHAETQALHEIQERVRAYPAETRDKVRGDIETYVTYVVGTEWDRMIDDGSLTERGDELFATVRHDLTDYEPKNDFEAQAYQPLLDQITAADDARSARGDASAPTLPGVVWFGLIAGALVTVGMMFALQIRRTPRELILAGLFSALIAFLLFLVWDFDMPYSRDMAASTEPFRELVPRLMS
ncbi:DUF4239 domain-containing protein [Streptomyces sp. NA04227]|uniref:bestrophin-like domain n=1 Tax=Streptomyces sp. NA04227 TaxID=2742136 RepID=UPI00159135E2|nr:DUF4239 domain-containing protein [Streptomyces sp. NA04227]QKW10327.1 DUF4239 domain-containing protein [Streptomyces sp. NA04227]